MLEKIKPNVLYIATLSFVAFCAIGVVMLYGDFSHEIQLILAAALGGSGVAFLSLGAQVATDNPPNHVKNVLDTVEKLSMKLMDKLGK